MQPVTFLICTWTLILACPLPAETQLAPPGSETWREIFDPPFTKPTELPAKSPLRKALFEQLRPRIEKDAKHQVRFAGTLRVVKNWALFTGTTVDAKGNSVKMPPMDNDDTAALWLRTRDGWKLVDFSSGHSDPVQVIWTEKYGLPRELVGF